MCEDQGNAFSCANGQLSAFMEICKVVSATLHGYGSYSCGLAHGTDATTLATLVLLRLRPPRVCQCKLK